MFVVGDVLGKLYIVLDKKIFESLDYIVIIMFWDGIFYGMMKNNKRIRFIYLYVSLEKWISKIFYFDIIIYYYNIYNNNSSNK